MSTQPNSSAPQPATSERRAATPAPRGDSTKQVFLIAWGVSAAVHAVLLTAFALITVNTGNAGVAKVQETVQTQVDDDPSKADLENDDLGTDPSQLLNYNIKQIDNVSVPGPVNEAESPGIKGMEESTPTTIPPPPGLGTEGQGGANATKTDGLTGPAGFAGGMQGLFTPGGFGGRTGSTRERMVREGGGNTESEAAVAAGQKWLVLHQSTDGHWSLDSFDQHQGGRCNCTGFGVAGTEIGATALGLLPLLGAGETHRNPRAAYRSNVDRALRYLMTKQAKDGNYGGNMYSHGLATIAVCEAFAMTGDPALKGSAQRAVSYIRQAQASDGGWRYSPKEAGDLSVTGWQIMALKSAQMAGLEVDDARNPTFSKASKFMDSVYSAADGGYKYMPQDGPSPTMTSVGLLCRLYMGTGPKNSGIIAGVNRLKMEAPRPGFVNYYYYYYATQVMHHAGGEAWDYWNPRIRDLLIKTQDKGLKPKQAHLKGSWSPQGDPFGGAGGRIMSTSMALLTLEVYYRHLPLFRRDLGGKTVDIR